VVGAIAVAVGSVMPWATLRVGGFEISASGTDGDGVLTIGLAFVLLAVGVAGLLGRSRLAMAITAVVASAGVLLVAAVDLTHIGRVVGGGRLGADGFFDISQIADLSTGVGLYVVLVGAIVCLGGGAVWLVRR
jgi:hypothetical protein